MPFNDSHFVLFTLIIATAAAYPPLVCRADDTGKINLSEILPKHQTDHHGETQLPGAEKADISNPQIPSDPTGPVDTAGIGGPDDQIIESEARLVDLERELLFGRTYPLWRPDGEIRWRVFEPLEIIWMTPYWYLCPTWLFSSGIFPWSYGFSQFGCFGPYECNTYVYLWYVGRFYYSDRKYKKPDTLKRLRDLNDSLTRDYSRPVSPLHRDTRSSILHSRGLSSYELRPSAGRRW